MEVLDELSEERILELFAAEQQTTTETPATADGANLPVDERAQRAAVALVAAWAAGPELDQVEHWFRAGAAQQGLRTEDLRQTVLERLLRAAQTDPAPILATANPKRLFATGLQHLIVDGHRQQTRGERAYRQHSILYGPPGASIMSSESSLALSSLVRSAMSQLPLQQRTALFLHYFADLSGAEICAIMDLGPSALKSTELRGRENMRGILRAMGVHNFREAISR